MANITIIVNQRPFHLDATSLSATDIRSLVEAPDDYEVWKTVNNPDPEGQLPVDDVQITDSIEVKSGDRFRVVPPGTFGSTTTMPSQLFEDLFVAELQDWLGVIQENRPPKVSGAEGAKSVKLIEQCYRHRQLWKLPWVQASDP